MSQILFRNLSLLDPKWDEPRGGYEVLVEGEWTPVPTGVIQNVTAPDGGAHVCFPKQPSYTFPKGTLFCVVLPPET